jgi:transcriptional regulator GlxA family with amidase domain
MAADARIANMLRRHPGRPFSTSEIAGEARVSQRLIQRIERSAIAKIQLILNRRNETK